jgi:hypothetical protein
LLRHAMLLRTTFSLEGFAASWATFYSTEIKIAGNRDMVAVRRPRMWRMPISQSCRLICLSSIPPSQYLHGLRGADNQTRAGD